MLARTGLVRLIETLNPWDGLLVFNYHRIGDGTNASLDPELFSATKEEFEAQLCYYQKHFDLISAEDLPHARRSRGRYLQISFDDGYRDNYETAFPILKLHRAPATFFVTTGFVDSPGVAFWDELAWMVRVTQEATILCAPWVPKPMSLRTPKDRAIATKALATLAARQPPDQRRALLNELGKAANTGRCDPSVGEKLWMTWDMIRELHRAGMSVGGHTVHHAELAYLGADSQAAEVRECKRRLDEELATSTQVFAYPFGGPESFSQSTRQAVEAAGFSYAYSFFGGFQRLGAWDNLNLRRLPIESHVSPDLVSAITSLPQVFARPQTRVPKEMAARTAVAPGPRAAAKRTPSMLTTDARAARSKGIVAGTALGGHALRGRGE